MWHLNICFCSHAQAYTNIRKMLSDMMLYYVSCRSPTDHRRVFKLFWERSAVKRDSHSKTNRKSRNSSLGLSRWLGAPKQNVRVNVNSERSSQHNPSQKNGFWLHLGATIHGTAAVVVWCNLWHFQTHYRWKCVFHHFEKYTSRNCKDSKSHGGCKRKVKTVYLGPTVFNADSGCFL